MAQHSVASDGQDRGHPPAVAREGAMADRVHTAVERLQPTTLDAVVDGIEGEPDRGKLRPAHDAVLVGRDRGDRRVDGTSAILTVYFRHNVRRVSHVVHRGGPAYARPHGRCRPRCPRSGAGGAAATRLRDRPAAGPADRGGGARRARRRDRGGPAVGARVLPRRRRRAVDVVRPLPRIRARADPRPARDPRAGRADDPADAEAAAHHADARHVHAGVGVAARPQPRDDRLGLRQPRLDRRLVRRRGRDGGHRARGARAGERRRPVRAQEAAAEPGDHRQPDEALHLHRRDHRRDAGDDARDHDQDRDRMSERGLPPVAEPGVVSMALIVAGGTSIASTARGPVPLAVPVLLLAASALTMCANLVLLARAPAFNWDAFFDVAKWALLAYAVIAAMLEFVFVNDGTRGGVLVVLTLSLVVYAVHVPLLIGFTVARYQ